MLRGSSLSTATVSVVRSDSNPHAVLRALRENRDSDVVRVDGRRDDEDPLVLTLDIYVLPQHQAAVDATATLTSFEMPDVAPSFARKCSWVTLKYLREDVLQAIGGVTSDNSNCHQCTQVVEYLDHCFKRPTVFDRAWNGAMVLSVTKAAHFVNTLVQLVCSMDKDSDNHENVAAVLSSFLVPGFKKTE